MLHDDRGERAEVRAEARDQWAIEAEAEVRRAIREGDKDWLRDLIQADPESEGLFDSDPVEQARAVRVAADIRLDQFIADYEGC